MLIVRTVLTNFIILIIIIINVLANDLLDSKGEFGKETENGNYNINNITNNVVGKLDNDIKSSTSECKRLHANNQNEISRSFEDLANFPTKNIKKRLPITDEEIARGVADSGTCSPTEKEAIIGEVHNLLRIHRNENGKNVVPKSTRNTKSTNNKSTQTESLLDEPLELTQAAIQQSYPIKGNYDIASSNDTSSYSNTRSDFNSNSNEDLHAQQANIFINADSAHLRNTDYTIMQQITETINTYNSNAAFVSAGNNDISARRLSLWHSIDLMQSRFINCPLYSDYYLNTYSVSVGINEYIGNQMMIGLVLSHFKLHHMLLNNNILTRSFNYVSLYGKYDFNNGISIQNIIGTTYSINRSHYYNNLRLDTKLYPFKNNSNILLIVSNDITFFYTSKANIQQAQSLDTSIKCSIGYIWTDNSIKVTTEMYYLFCCNIWNNNQAQTQLNKNRDLSLMSDYYNIINTFHRHSIGTKLTIKTNIIKFSMSIGACFQNNYVTNFGMLGLQVNF